MVPSVEMNGTIFKYATITPDTKPMIAPTTIAITIGRINGNSGKCSKNGRG